jgi:predicted GNAT superfamily acetyltransferase
MSSSKGLEYKRIFDIDECEKLGDLQRDVWQFEDIDIAAPDVIMVHAHLDACVIGVYKGEEVVAFVYSFHGISEGEMIHWSHMCAVKEEYRGLGLGKTLKLKQRDFVLEQGFKTVRWTFDPLETLNARLNIRTLGATVYTYRNNIYGESSGFLHRGLPTDRMEATWRLDSERVERAIAGKALTPELEMKDLPLMLQAVWNSEIPEVGEINLDLEEEFIACPIVLNIREIKFSHNEIAMSWRMKTRKLFTNYFKKGYEIVDVQSPAETGQNLALYVFRRRK